MKIVVLDGYTENPGDLSWSELEKLGELTVYDRTPLDDEGEIIRRIGGAEIVYTNKTPISKRVIDACPGMKMISLLAAGLDVVYTEPIRSDNPLLKAKNCIITPHISWAPKESRQRIMDCAVENAKAYLAGAPVHVVNR